MLTLTTCAPPPPPHHPSLWLHAVEEKSLLVCAQLQLLCRLCNKACSSCPSQCSQNADGDRWRMDGQPRECRFRKRFVHYQRICKDWVIIPFTVNSPLVEFLAMSYLPWSTFYILNLYRFNWCETEVFCVILWQQFSKATTIKMFLPS